MLYPLRFRPLFKGYLWGGQRLQQMLEKQTGPGVWAESWELVDHDQGQSIVSAGQLAGLSLAELVDRSAIDLVGETLAQRIRSRDLPPHVQNRFPLLLKFLDANKNLSIQVHPNDEQAARLAKPDLGKTEAWYVMHAEPGAMIYAGLKAGVGRDDFSIALDRGNIVELMHQFTPCAGDCIFIPAGTVHALGGGLLIAEIQQASDTTFRIFDWNRVDDRGNARPLHVQQSLDVIDFTRGPVHPTPPIDLSDRHQLLVRCGYFELARWRLDRPVQFGGDDRFHILVTIEGVVQIEGDPSGQDLNQGQTVLLPACMPPTNVRPADRAIMLEITVPI